MNDDHTELCSSQRWAEQLQAQVIPWALDGIALHGSLLEVGPGYGAATAWLRDRVTSLVAVEKDRALAARLAAVHADDPVVTVEEGDGTALRFADASFDLAACFTMLHHVPSVDLQDRLLREVARVLTPGGTFFGADSLGGPAFVEFHHDDICVPVDPLTLRERLLRCGFGSAEVEVLSLGVSFRATTPVLAEAR